MFSRTLFRPIVGSPASAARTFSSSAVRPIVAKVTLVGRMVAEPEMKSSSSGIEYITYCLACSDRTAPGAEPSSSFFNIAAFLSNDKSKQYLQGIQKGSLCYFEGDISFGRYEKDGEAKKVLNIKHRSIQALQRKHEEDEIEHGDGRSSR